jgi:hypothetical protein
MSRCAARWLILASVLVLGLASLHGEPMQAGSASGVAVSEIKQLIAQLGDDHFRIRERATQDLIDLGRSALPLVRGAMDHRDAEIANRAQRIVAEIQASPAYLLEILGESDPKLRQEAAAGLERLGPYAKEALPALVAALKDNDDGVREAVVSAIVAIDPFHTAIEEHVPAKAHAEGKYARLLRRFKAPQDRQSYTEFRDYGFYQACDWAGHTSIPAGYWVYAYPYWYIWKEQMNKEQANKGQ